MPLKEYGGGGGIFTHIDICTWKITPTVKTLLALFMYCLSSLWL